MSRQILEEIVGKFVEKGIDEDLILEFVEVVGKLALIIPGSYVLSINLAAAQEGGADYIVSLDAKHLLPLKHHKGTQIVDPKLFLRVIDR